MKPKKPRIRKVDWSNPKQADIEHCRRARRDAASAHRLAAIHTSKTPSGVVVVNPSKDSSTIQKPN